MTGLIPLTPGSWVAEDSTSNKKHTCLAIGAPGRVFFMFFDTDADRLRWLEILQGVVGKEAPKDIPVVSIAGGSESSRKFDRIFLVSFFLLEDETTCSQLSMSSPPQLKHAVSTVGFSHDVNRNSDKAPAARSVSYNNIGKQVVVSDEYSKKMMTTQMQAPPAVSPRM